MDDDPKTRSIPNATTTTDEDINATTTDGGVTSGGEHAGKTGGKQLKAGFPLAKPTNFFELLAAAMSVAKMEQRKDVAFFNYLHKSGIKTSFVRAIVALYEEPIKPDDPLAYMVQLMGLGIPDPGEVMATQDEVKYLRQRVLDLQTEQENLKNLIEKAEQAMLRHQDDLSSREDDKLFSEFDSDEYTDDLVRGGSVHFC